MGNKLRTSLSLIEKRQLQLQELRNERKKTEERIEGLKKHFAEIQEEHEIQKYVALKASLIDIKRHDDSPANMIEKGQTIHTDLSKNSPKENKELDISGSSKENKKE